MKFVITGNRLYESLFTSYPSSIWFDGELFKNATPADFYAHQIERDNAAAVL